MPVPGRTFLVGGHHGHEDAVGGLLRHERAQQPPWSKKQVLVLNNQKVFGLEKQYTQRRDLVEGQEAPVVGAMGRRGDAFGRRRLCEDFDSRQLWRPLTATKFFFAGAAKGMVATSAKNATLHLLTFSVFLFYRCAV